MTAPVEAPELRGRSVRGIYAGIVAATLLWSGAFIIGALAVDLADPIVVAAQRYVVAAAAFAVALTVLRAWTIPTWPVAGLIGLGAVFGVLIYNIGFFIGLEQSTVTRGTLIVATMPAWVILIDAALAWRAPPKQQVAGVALSFVGVAVLFWDGGGLGFNRGDLGFVVAPISWAIYSVFVRRTVADIPVFVATGYTVILGGAMLLAFTWITGRPGALSTRLFDMDILYLGVVATVVAFALWFKGIAVIGTARTSIFVNLVPIWGLVLAAVVLGEVINARILAALALVLAGVVIVQRSGLAKDR